MMRSEHTRVLFPSRAAAIRYTSFISYTDRDERDTGDAPLDLCCRGIAVFFILCSHGADQYKASVLCVCVCLIMEEHVPLASG